MTQETEPHAGGHRLGDGRAGGLPHRDAVDVLAAQLEGLRRWHEHRRATEEVVDLRGMNRELRLDLQRHQLARARQHEALLARSAVTLAAGERLLSTRPPRLLLVHRHRWVRERLAQELLPYGVEVVGLLDDGADAVGVAVAEQPDLLLVEDALPTMTGAEVLAALGPLCPSTAFAAHVEHPQCVGALVAAGAAQAFPRRVPPPEVARELVAMVRRAPVTTPVVPQQGGAQEPPDAR